MHQILRALLIACVALAGLVAFTTPASAAYRYTSAAQGVSVSGVRFYTVVEYDSVTKHVRATGIIDARMMSSAGRLNFVSLDRYSNAAGDWVNVANTPSGVTKATNDYLAWSTGPVICSPGASYRARIQYHIDGTSITGSLSDYSPPLTCG